MPYLPALVVSMLLWTPTVSGNSHGVLRKQQQMRPFKQDPKNPRARKSPRRELQRAASICADNPSPFLTSMYVSLVGDGTPFRQEDADTLLRLVLRAYNQAGAENCDTTYRTIAGISVGDVYYTDQLDFIRLRLDLDGSCDGCLPSNMESGVGPLFGGAENSGLNRRALAFTSDDQGEEDNSLQLGKSRRGIKGRSYRPKRNLQKDDDDDDKDKKKSDDDDKDEGDSATGTTGSTGFGQPTQVIPAGSGNPDNQGSGMGGTTTTSSGTSGSTVTTTTGSWTGGTQGTGTFPPGIDVVCGCSTATTTPGGPSPSDFALILNSMIQTARADGTLSGASFVEDLFEASVAGRSSVLANLDSRQVVGTCDAANNQDFTTTLWLEITPFAPTILDLPEAEMLPLEVAVMESYNEMMLLSCDVPFFRIVTDVSHQETRQSGDKLQLRFDVSGKCVNCDPNTITLFDDSLVGDVDVINVADAGRPSVINVPGFRAPSRSLLESEIELLEVLQAGPVIVERDVSTSCTCPLNIGDLPLRSPTSDEFVQVLRTAVETLAAANRVSSIQEVVRVQEGEIDSVCSADITTFNSAVFVDFEGSPRLLNSSEITVLEGGFKDTYNELIFNSCDEYFRTIVEVRLVPGISRRRLGLGKRRLQTTTFGNAGNSSDVSDLQSEAPSVYMVTGQCRGCPISPMGSFALFNDAFRFRKLMEGGASDQANPVVPHYYTYPSMAEALQNFMSFEMMNQGHTGPVQRRLQDCTCPLGAEPDGPAAPTANEHRARYNQEIARYNQIGSVVNVQSITAYVEVPPNVLLVGFSMFYGDLVNLGDTTPGDYVPLVAQSESFYRKHLIEHYNANSVSLASVNLEWTASTPREDLDKLQVDFTAELVFAEYATNIPTKQVVTDVMENLDYVEYITQYVWRIDPSESVFTKSHSVRFAGREDALVETRLYFDVGSARTNQIPSIADRNALREQIELFFLDVLRNAGFQVMAVRAHIDADDIEFIASGSVLVDFESTIIFYSDDLVPIPTKEEITTVLRSADLEVLRTQYLNAGGPVGTAIFTDSFGIAFDTASP